MMYVMSGVFLIGFALSSTGCSQAVPTTTTIGQSIKSPTYSGSTTKTFIIPAYNSSTLISGECDAATTAITMSTDSGTTWASPPTAGSDLDCTDGTFSFTFTDCSTLGLTSGSAPGTKVSIQLRSQTALGMSQSSNFFIQLNSSYQIQYADVGAGGGKTTSANYKIQNKIGTIKSSTIVSSSSYKIHLTGSD